MTTLTGEDVWEAGQDVIIGTNPPGGKPRYERARVSRVTPSQVILETGARFWKDLGVEVGSQRVILPPWSPSYPILEAQIAERDRVQDVATAAVRFSIAPDRAHALAVRYAVDTYLENA